VRPAHLKALRAVHAQLAQQLDRVLVADPLGDRAHAHAPGDVHQGAHQQPVVRAGAQSADELAVDLQAAEGQALEVVEGAEAHAEVIQRQGAAERRGALAEGLRAGHVGDGRRLGHLQRQARGGHAVAQQLALDVAQHLRIDDREGREVDGDAHALAVREAAHGPAHHQPVDLADQAVALGRSQPRAGGKGRGIRFVGEAHERLVVVHLAAGQVQDRLVVQHEQVLSQRSAQARQPPRALQGVAVERTRGEHPRGHRICSAPHFRAPPNHRFVFAQLCA